jgi:hypothetical protein
VTLASPDLGWVKSLPSDDCEFPPGCLLVLCFYLDAHLVIVSHDHLMQSYISRASAVRRCQAQYCRRRGLWQPAPTAHERPGRALGPAGCVALYRRPRTRGRSARTGTGWRGVRATSPWHFLLSRLSRRLMTYRTCDAGVVGVTALACGFSTYRSITPAWLPPAVGAGDVSRSLVGRLGSLPPLR